MDEPTGASDRRGSDAWRAWRAANDLDEYEQRWDRLEAAGQHVHGEADFVASLSPRRVLDAGCGMGRVAIELDRRGIEVTGVDLDPDLLERARRRAPHLDWVESDLARFERGHRDPFDVVVLAGNVLPFVEPAGRADVIRACARALTTGGHLVTGFGLADGWPGVDDLDSWCASAGLVLVERYAGWDREPWRGSDGRYAVSIHRRT